MKHNVYLCQVNNKYGNNVFLPYSVGLIQAYCQTIPEINENFDFKGLIYLRDDPENAAKSLERPEIVGISCYVWNFEWSKAFARSVKAHHPDCLVVMGGPQVPVRSENFFVEHSYVDILAHYEGEIAYSEILLEYLNEPRDFTGIPGLSVRLNGNQCYKTPTREKLIDLTQLPSPYLTGVFDDLVRLPYSWNASQETHRGCPYSCTFCDWGSAVYTKVRAFDDARLEQEFEYFGKSRIELLFNCDANYGLLPRDPSLTQKLVETKRRYEFPKQFRASFAKNSNMKIFQMAKLLNEAKMDKGVTISFQSMDPQTLKEIKRFNIKVTDFSNLVKLYRNESIPTYTELIMGLPGETYDTFADGIVELLRAGQHEGLNIYLCSVLPNAEMADPSYREKHGIKSVRTQLLQQHATPSTDEVVEYADYAIETKTMAQEDWRRVYLFSWAVQSFHTLALTQCLALFLHLNFGLSYRTFYEMLLDFAKKNPQTLIGQELEFVDGVVDKALQGGTWEVVMPEFGNVKWPTEEATFLKIVCQKDRFYSEIRDFLDRLLQRYKLDLEEGLLEDLITWQKNMVRDPFAPKSIPLSLRYNLHEYFHSAYLGERIEFVKGQYCLNVHAKAEYGGDLETFAREAVWYGRKGGRFLHSSVIETQLPALSAIENNNHNVTTKLYNI